MIDCVDPELFDELNELEADGDDRASDVAKALADKLEEKGEALKGKLILIRADAAAADRHSIFSWFYLHRACTLVHEVLNSEPLTQRTAVELELLARVLIRAPKRLGGDANIALACICAGLGKAYRVNSDAPFTVKALLHARNGEALICLGENVESSQVEEKFHTAYHLLPSIIVERGEEIAEKEHHVHGFSRPKVRTDNRLEVTRNELPVLYSVGSYYRRWNKNEKRSRGLSILYGVKSMSKTSMKNSADRAVVVSRAYASMVERKIGRD